MKHKYIETPEIWKPIPEYKGYEVSNLGNVRSYRKRGCGWISDTHHSITPGATGRKGRYLGFYASNEKGRVKLLVHRCVANAFMSNEESKPQVHHVDNNGHNNTLLNLEWVTNSENQLHRTDRDRPSGYKYVYQNRTTWRAANKRQGFDRCFKTKKVAAAFAMQYY